MAQNNIDIGGIYGMGVLRPGDTIADLRTNALSVGGQTITEQDIVKFHKLLAFMDFAMSASEEMRNLMVAFEAKQRILK